MPSGIEDNWFKPVDYTLPDEAYAQLRLAICHYISAKIGSKFTLTDLPDRTMPEIKKLFCGKRSEESTKEKLNDFIEEYWHFDNITKKSEAQFICSYCNWTKKKGYPASESEAKAICFLSCDGIPTLPSGIQMLTLEAVRILKEGNKTPETILTQMQGLAITLPEYGMVRAMNGVGNVLAPRLIAEIGDERRFHCGSALIAFAGIDSPPYQSGVFTDTRIKNSCAFSVYECFPVDLAEKDFLLRLEVENLAIFLM